MKNIKKIVLKTALVLLGSAMATNADAQHIEAKSQTINVGQVKFRQPVTVDYQLHNRGHHTLYIDQVRTSCGCTTVDYPLTSIRGDEFFTVRAVFDAKQMGHFTKQIGIYANGSKTPYILTLKGVVVEEVTDFVGDYPYQLGDLLTDQNAIEFDDVNRGDLPMAKIHILNNTDHPVQPDPTAFATRHEQLDFLASIDCDIVQGYYYSRPVPVEEFEAFMERYR